MNVRETRVSGTSTPGWRRARMPLRYMLVLIACCAMSGLAEAQGFGGLPAEPPPADWPFAERRSPWPGVEPEPLDFWESARRPPEPPPPQAWHEGIAARFLLDVDSAVLDTQEDRARARVFDIALRTFARAGSVERSLCAFDPLECRDTWMPVPRNHPEVQVRVLLRTTSSREENGVIRTTFAPGHPETDVVDVRMGERELLMRACEIVKRQRPIRCSSDLHVRESLSRPLVHPGDALVVIEPLDGRVGVAAIHHRSREWEQESTALGWTVQPTAVRAETRWQAIRRLATPVYHGDPWVRTPSLRGGASFTVALSAEHAELVRYGVVELVFIEDGEETQAEYLGRSVEFLLPQALGQHSAQIELRSKREGDPSPSVPVSWEELGDVPAGSFYRCVAREEYVEEWVDPQVLPEEVRGDEVCQFAPWWSAGSVRTFLPPSTRVQITRGPSRGVFFSWMCLVAFFGLLLARRRPRPARFATRVGTRETYREAPAEAWRMSTLAEFRARDGLRLLWTPLGLFVWCDSPVHVRAPGGELRLARRFSVEPGTLIVMQGVQHVCLGLDDALESVVALASEEDLEVADDALARTNARKTLWVRALGIIGTAVAMAMLASALVFLVSQHVGRLTQTRPFQLSSLGVLLVLLVVSTWAFRRRGTPEEAKLDPV